jgi:ubiquinone biosynthesis UbiH/UbiF/VisC/COQ6 family hydroxylase
MRVDIAIVGAGLVGASLARSLAQTSFSLAVVEGAPPPERTREWDARIYALSPGNVAFLDALGAWGALDRSRVCPVRAMRIFGDDGRSRMAFSAYETGVNELAWNVEAGELQRALWMLLERQPNLTLVYPARPVSLEVGAGAATLGTDGGHLVQARLLVGADGANSWVRREAGFDADARSYGEQGVVANFACERPHRDIALQWFRADGVLAFLPLPGERISIVWSTSDAHAAELMSLPPDEFCTRVAEAGAGMLGKLDLLTPPAAFPLAHLAVRHSVKPRLALIGDAAHVVHPLAGQGVNLGFGDARALAAMLEGRPASRDPGDYSLLRRFERSRAEDILAMRLLTDGLQRLFGARQPWVARLRNLGLNLTDAIPVVKTMLARRAMR